jgi:hypothetical protein
MIQDDSGDMLRFDDDDEQPPIRDAEDARRRHSSLNLSISRDESQGVSAGVAEELNLSDIEAPASKLTAAHDKEEEQDTPLGGKRKASTNKPRGRKRRKILTDGNDTELSIKHIRKMLADTSNIVQQISCIQQLCFAIEYRSIFARLTLYRIAKER